ncbi:MAG: hypothetical protein Kow0077_15030 [Anaerolineae bacterium]
MIPPRPFFYRNAFARIILLTLEEALSRDVLNALLYSAGLKRYINRLPPADFEQGVPAQDIRTLFHTLGQLHDTQDTHQLACACGEAIARYLLTESWTAGATPPALTRHYSAEQRKTSGLQIMNDLLGEFSPRLRARVISQADGFLFVLEDSRGAAIEAPQDDPIYHLMLGFLMRGMSIFLQDGREFRGRTLNLPENRIGLFIYHTPAA